MEFADFVNNFKHILEESLEQFSKKHNLKYDYSLTIVYNHATFRAELWYERDGKIYYSMLIDFTLESTEKGIVVKARKENKTRVITIRKTSKNMDRLKNSIIRRMEELLEEDLKELEEKLRNKRFLKRIKNIIGEHDLYELQSYIYVIIGRSGVEIFREEINNELYPKEIYIEFEKKEECVIFADFIENSISIDKTKIEVDPLRIVSIDLESLEPEKRFDVLKKVIEALEMMYLF